MDEFPNSSCRSGQTRKGHPGFTLVELLTVVAIIGLLLAVLTPTLVRARMLGRRSVCQANLSAVGKGAILYDSDFDAGVPICWANVAPDKQHPWKSWRASLLPYVAGFGAFNCPSVSDRGVGGERFHSAEEVGGQQMTGTINAGSYGVIYQYSLPSYTTINYAGIETQGHPMWSCTFSTVPGEAWRSPSDSIYVADAVFIDGPITYPSGPGYKGYGTSAIEPPSPSVEIGPGDPPTRRFADRHVGTACLFVDGHVLSYETERLDSMVAGEMDCVWDTE